MRAIQIDRYGGTEVMQERAIPVPQPGLGEVLIRLAFSGINFMDVYTRLGRYAGSGVNSGHYQAGLPLTLGIEGAGHIEAIGASVSGWRIGERVVYALARGSYAEYAVVPAWQLARVPDAIGLDQAVAAMFQGLTAHYLAFDIGRLGPGRSCLVHAGSGGIGQLLIQLAKSEGAVVAATASTPEKAAVARRRGADVVADYANDEYVDAAKSLSNGEGVDVVFDSLGAATFQGSMRALKRKGLFVLYGTNSGPLPTIDPMELANNGSLFFTRPRLADYIADSAMVTRRAQRIFGGLEDKSLRIEVANVHDFADVSVAHRALEERRSVGKSILRVDMSVS
jgi:NADPH2:quinone reductase